MNCRSTSTIQGQSSKRRGRTLGRASSPILIEISGKRAFSLTMSTRTDSRCQCVPTATANFQGSRPCVCHDVPGAVGWLIGVGIQSTSRLLFSLLILSSAVRPRLQDPPHALRLAAPVIWQSKVSTYTNWPSPRSNPLRLTSLQGCACLASGICHLQALAHRRAAPPADLGIYSALAGNYVSSPLSLCPSYLPPLARVRDPARAPA
jgi:hypothetical protein